MSKLDSGKPNSKSYDIQKDEEYMNSKQLQHFREILENWRSELAAENEKTVTSMKEGSINFSCPDAGDRAAEEETFSYEVRSQERINRLIAKIVKALQRIENREYGFCEKCGEDIGVRRLEARPTATLCIECKTLDEIREKHIGDN